MAKVGKAKQLRSFHKKHHANLRQKPSCALKVAKKMKQRTVAFNNDWQDSTCSVCMESPHNAFLLLCSSYKKGCRPYMCGTSYRLSNCLDQYKKAYTKQTSLETAQPSGGVPQLSCPICRGQVKGWTVVEQARKDLNEKQRNCMEEKCCFVGSYKQLKKHVKSEHPMSRPRDVDPAREEKWKILERETERNDVISAVTSSDPSALVFGDFVIEGGRRGLNSWLFRNRSDFVSDRGTVSLCSLVEDEGIELDDDDDEDDDNDDDGVSV